MESSRRDTNRFEDEDECNCCGDDCCGICDDEKCAARGIDPEGTCVQCFVFIIMTMSWSCMNFIIILPWFGLTTKGLIHLAIFNTIFAMLFFSYLRASFTKNFVPETWHPSDSEYPEAILGDDKQPKYCEVCKRFKPPRSHHCSTCGKCVLRMDHHCPWVNNCVGHMSHKYFFQFLFWTAVGCGYYLIMSLVYLFNSCLFHVGSKLAKDVLSKGQLGTNSTAIIDGADNCIPVANFLFPLVIGVTIVIALVFGMMVMLLLGWQLHMAVANETEIENWQAERLQRQAAKRGQIYVNPYNRGRWKDNLSDICGVGSMWHWLLPCSPILSPGTNFKYREYASVRGEDDSEVSVVGNTSTDLELGDVRSSSKSERPDNDVQD